jgi:hypothetical protein
MGIMPRRTKQKLGPVRAARSIAGGKSKRQVYADFRHLVSLETVVKQLKTRAARRKAAELSKPAPSDSQAPAVNSSTVEPEPTREDSIAKNGNGSEPVSSSVLLLVDQRISMFYGSKQKTKSVAAAEAAAFVAWREFKHHNPVGALVFNDRRIAEVWPGCSRVQIMLILHDVLNQNHSLSKTIHRSNSGMLNQALRRAQTLAGRVFRTVLITDGAGSDEETGSLLVNIARQHQLIMVRVYDPGQVRPCNSGSFITDGHNAWQNLAGSHLASTAIATIPINAGGDVSRQLRQNGFVRLFASRDHGTDRGGQQTDRVQNESSRTNALAGANEMERGVTGTSVPSSSPVPAKSQLLCA